MQVGFNSEGVIQALELELYCNAGCSVDLSYGVCVITDYRHVPIVKLLLVCGRCCHVL